MPLILKKILAYILIFNILIASVGVSLYHHSCTMSGEVHTSFYLPKATECCEMDKKEYHHQQEADGCCEEEEKKEDCCHHHSYFVKADLEGNSISHFSFQFLNVFSLPTFYDTNLLVYLPSIEDTPLFFTDSSPPSAGRLLVIQNQSFLL